MVRNFRCFIVGIEADLIVVCGIEIDLVLVAGVEVFFVFVCGPKVTWFSVWIEIYLILVEDQYWLGSSVQAETVLFSGAGIDWLRFCVAGRNWLSLFTCGVKMTWLCVDIEIHLVLAWVVRHDLMSVCEIEINLGSELGSELTFCVGVENDLVLYLNRN